jgi:hypothetical protein
MTQSSNPTTTYRIVQGERTDLETFEVVLRSTGRTVIGALSVSECRRHLEDLIRLGHLPAGEVAA